MTLKLFQSHRTPTIAEEQQLLQRYRTTKNTKWIGKLFEPYMAMIYGVCLRYTPDTSEAQDFVMEVYLLVQDKALKHDIANFRTWLYVVTKHYCLGQMRKLSGKKIQQLDPSFMQSAADVHPMLEDSELERKERDLDRLDQCMAKLNELQRRSIQLFYYEHKSYAQIAAILEAKSGQVRSLIQNGRRNLKNCMRK